MRVDVYKSWIKHQVHKCWIYHVVLRSARRPVVMRKYQVGISFPCIEAYSCMRTAMRTRRHSSKNRDRFMVQEISTQLKIG